MTNRLKGLDLIECLKNYGWMFMELMVVGNGHSGLPRWLSGEEFACNVGDTGSTLGWEDPLEEEMATHSSILAREIPGDRGTGGL